MGLKVLPFVEVSIAEGGLRTQGLCKTLLQGKPLITIVSVVLNRAHCLEACIQSVLNQSYDNIELIIFDGGSTDGTLNILQAYNDKIDYWVSEPDLGLYFAMNKAVTVAGGDWIIFLGSDDMLLDCLDRIVPHLQNEQTIYYGNVYGIANNRIYNGTFTRYRLYVNALNHQGIFYPRSVFTAYKYENAYKIAADYDLNLRCYIDGGYLFDYIRELVAIQNDIDGLSCNSSLVFREFLLIIYRRCGLLGVYYSSMIILIYLLELMCFKEPLKWLISCFLRNEGSHQDLLQVAKSFLNQKNAVQKADRTHHVEEETV